MPLWHGGIADSIERVSTGANVTAALRPTERLCPIAVIVTVMCATGMKYLKTFSLDLKPRT